MLGLDEHFETSSLSRGSAKEPASLQCEDHMMNARRGDGKEALHVGLGGGVNSTALGLRLGRASSRCAGPQPCSS